METSLNAYPILVKFNRGMNIRSAPTISAVKAGSVLGGVWYKAHFWHIKSSNEFWIGMCPAPCKKWVCWLKDSQSYVLDIIMPHPDSDLSSYKAKEVL